MEQNTVKDRENRMNEFKKKVAEQVKVFSFSFSEYHEFRFTCGRHLISGIGEEDLLKQNKMKLIFFKMAGIIMPRMKEFEYHDFIKGIMDRMKPWPMDTPVPFRGFVD